MRTRTSNRTKSFAVEKYDFDVSSDEEEEARPTPSTRRRRIVEDEDDNFDEVESVAESPDDEPALESDDSASASAAEPDPRERFYRQKIRRIQPFNVRAVDAPTGYMPVEPIPPEGFMGKAYAGPFERSFRAQNLVIAWYGPLEKRIVIAQKVLDRWSSWTVLPPKTRDRSHGLPDKGVWTPEWAEKEAYFAEKLVERLKETGSGIGAFNVLSAEDAWPYRLPMTSMPVLMGPHDGQQETMFTPGNAHAISHSGLPLEEDQSEAEVSTGWMLDTGGIPLAMDWRPSTEYSTQILAVALIPHHDQEVYNYEEESVKPYFHTDGIVQLWEFTGHQSVKGFIPPSTQRPKLQKTLCLGYGRARRVRWSPVGGHLAILYGNGKVCVVAPSDEGDDTYETPQQPLTLELVDEPGIKASAMTWVTFNRLAVGYSDGSIALWSVHPKHLLSRHPVHHSEVVNIASGYPTMPYIIASNPIGGNTKLFDLQAPSYETSEVQTVMVCTQPNMIAYSDHLLGFFTLYPSSSSLNTIVGFLHHSQFPIFRRVFTGECFVTCLSVGRTHPFLLIGASDGSLWAVNPQVELFSSRREPSDRLRVFQHEHRPRNLFPAGSPAAQRGASRIIQGFGIVKNRNKVDARPVKGKKPKSDAQAANDDDETAGLADPLRAVVHEPLTRISAVEWNPNEGYGCWAAVAMASGLLRIIDLGLEASKR